MTVDVTVSEVIEAPRTRVAQFVMDHRNDPTWIGGISDSQLLGNQPFGVGSDVQRVASFVGRRIMYVNRVEELEPDTRLVMRSVKSPFPMIVTYAFADVPRGRTRTSVRVQGGPGVLCRIAGSLLEWQVRRSVTKDLRTLKGLMDSDTS